MPGIIQTDDGAEIQFEAHGYAMQSDSLRPNPFKLPASSERRVNPDAYEACLKGRFFWNRRTRENLYRALEFFAQSIEKDANYGPAFAGMADTYLVLLDYRYVVPKEALAMATAAAVNALRIDEALPDAHTSLAHAKLHALEPEFLSLLNEDSGPTFHS